MGMRKIDGVIYAVKDAREPERVRYVGLTTVGLRRRERGHWHQANEGRNLPISDWIRSRKERPQDVIFLELDRAETKEELDAKEVHWIAYYRGLGMADLNLAAGGGGSSGIVHRESTKSLWSSQRRNGGVASAVLDVDGVLELRRLSCSGMKDKDVASVLGIGIQTVGHVMRGESWGYVPWEDGTSVRAKPHRRANLSPDERDEIGARLNRGDSVKSIAADFGITTSRIGKMLANVEFRASHDLDSPEVVQRRRKSWNLEKSISNGGERSIEAKISEEDARRIKEMLFSGLRQSEVTRETGISRAIVQAIDRGVSWRHVPWPIGPRRKTTRGPRAGKME